MTGTSWSFDIVCLVADSNMKQTMLGLLDRPEALGIKPQLRHDLPVHPESDPGCLLRSPDFLRSYVHRSRYALVLFDREGCGRDESPREELEADLEQRLSSMGWEGRAAAVAIDPELEAWWWSDSPHVEIALGWKGRTPALRTWLEQQGYLAAGVHKPVRPKEAVETALRIARRPRSGSLYRQLASQVSFNRCGDAAFAKLRRTLQQWFATQAK